MPKQLDVIKTNTEGIFTDAGKKDWKMVQGKLKVIKTNLTELKPLMQITNYFEEGIK